MAGQLAARESSWVNEYLLGVVAECELPSDHGQLTTAAVRSSVGSISDPGARDAGDRTRAWPPFGHSGTTIGSSSCIPIRSGDITGRRRSRMAWARAMASPKRPITSTTASKRRPDNPTLHHHLAACLVELDRNLEAQREVETAIERAPTSPSFTGRAPTSGQTSGKPMGSPPTCATSSSSLTSFRACPGARLVMTLNNRRATDGSGSLSFSRHVRPRGASRWPGDRAGHSTGTSPEPSPAILKPAPAWRLRFARQESLTWPKSSSPSFSSSNPITSGCA